MLQLCNNFAFSAEIRCKFRHSLQTCLLLLLCVSSVTIMPGDESITSPEQPKRFDFTAFKQQGESLGLSGLELANFIKEREQIWLADAREERAAQREIQKHIRETRLREAEIEREKEERQAQIEREKEERQAQIEREKVERQARVELEKQEKQFQLEREQKEREAQFELQKLKIESDERLAKERIKVRGTDKEEPKSNKSFIRKLKLPDFDEKRCDIDTYLFRFEKHASACGVDESDWPIALAASLQSSRALEVYHSLSRDKSVSYDELKKALLVQFQCNEDGFREKFRALRPEANESFHVFTDRMKHCFDRWIELSGIKRDVDGFTDLFLREQFYQSCSKELVTFLKKEGCKTLDDVTETAERFRTSEPGKVLARKTASDVWSTASAINFQSTGGQDQQRSGGRGRARGRGHGAIIRGGRGGSSSDRGGRGGGNTGRGGHNVSNNTTGGNNTGGGQGEASNFQRSKCRRCGQTGHWARDCKAEVQSAGFCIPMSECHVCGAAYTMHTTCSHPPPQVTSLVSKDNLERLNTCEGKINGQTVKVLLDSGCTTIGVHRKHVSDDQYTGRMRHCMAFGGEIVSYPLARVHIDTPYYVGEIEACVLPKPICDVILGCFPGCTLSVAEPKLEFANAVQTRQQAAQAKKKDVPLQTADAPSLDVGPKELIQMQRDDKSLQSWFSKAKKGEKRKTAKGQISFVIDDDILYREFKPDTHGEITRQIIVPTKLRKSVLIAGHDSIVSGHMAAGSTMKRIAPYFFWPGFKREITNYCRSCDQCQRIYPKGKVPRAPLQSMPKIETPFQRVGIDLVGPFHPLSDRKHGFILTCVDFATRYPEAVPLQRIDSESVAEALISIFSRVGFPSEILSDNGSQFTSDLMKSVMRLLSISQLHSTIYHAQTNGLVERFHSTLKAMLRKMCHERPKDWDRYLPALLFAYREIPQSSTGFSPFELLFGRTPRGPLQLVRDIWSGKGSDKEAVSEYQYVCDLKERLSETCKLAQEAVQKSASKYKVYHDKNSMMCSLEKDDEVLVLLPTDKNKLLLKWQGPFKVVKRFGPCDYVIAVGRNEKVFHINMLKQYVRRVESAASAVCSGTSPPVDVTDMPSQVPSVMNDPFQCCSVAVGIIMPENALPDDDVTQVNLHTVPVPNGETYKDVKYDRILSQGQRHDLEQICSKFQDVLSDIPGQTSLVEHSIRLTSDKPVQVKQYPIPMASEAIVEREVNSMLRHKIIEPSNSPYCSPFILVGKKDKTMRFVIDFRALNKITIPDAEPIPDVETLFAKLRRFRYFSKIDLAKGYFQIKMSESDKHLTAFRTPQGLFCFRRMPFGLVTAPASFARLMRKLRLDEIGAVSYFDDILVGSEDWNSHPQNVEKVLGRLRQHGLTARPTKVELGFQELEFLGHLVSHGQIRPVPQTVDRILKLATPRTKKQVRSVIGLISFYRKYCNDFASITAPLVELTKRGKPSRVVWTEECQKALEKIQEILSSEPVLALPDINKPFTLRTDASKTGLGAVLLQEHDGEFHPVCYASRKLLDRETRYSVPEQECLGIVWGIDKFTRYLFGRSFCLETDHSSLKYLSENKLRNGRLMRWALALQEYQFQIVPISGQSNVEADCLSRLPLN